MSIKCSEVVNYNICLGYYRLISQMFEEEMKYIRNYKVILNEYFKKVLELQTSIGSKLDKPPEEFANATWLNFTPFVKITGQIPRIILRQIGKIKTFMEELDKTLKNIDNFLKEKSNAVKRFQQKYDESSSKLIKKYIDVEKMKISFLSSINKCEDIIGKYHDNKNKIDMAKINNKKDVELKALLDKNKDYEYQKKNLINSTKKYESEYNKIINKTIISEDNFLENVNGAVDGIKEVTCEISNLFKDIFVSFLSSFKDSLKHPLDLLERSLSETVTVNQIEKENMNKIMINTFNNDSKLKHLIPERYDLKALGSENINNEDNYFNTKKDRYIQFEDGFEEMRYFNDDITINSVKEMFNNFELINHKGINMEIEEEKILTKKYISKIISYMSDKKKNIDKYLDDNENKNLMNLLGKHHNRIIFLHKLNDYRASGLLDLREKEYKMLGEYFINIIEMSKKENDFHCIEMVIILSRTYYYLKDNKTKIYIQNYIVDTKYFKMKDFWDELILYSISKEIGKSNRKDLTIDNIINNRAEVEMKNKIKNENIIFSILLSLIENMFEFGVDKNLVKEIIEPKISYYQIGDNLKNTIYGVIDSKIKDKDTIAKEEDKK